MRRLMPAAVVLLVVVAILPAIADKAKTIYEKGQDAEARQNYESRLRLYKQAYDLKPKDLRYRASFRADALQGGRDDGPSRCRFCATRASCRRRWPNFKRRR